MNLQPAVNYLVSIPEIRSRSRLCKLIGVPPTFFFRLEKGELKGVRPEFQVRFFEVLAKYSGNKDFANEATKIASSLTDERLRSYFKKVKELDRRWCESLNEGALRPPSLGELTSL